MIVLSHSNGHLNLCALNIKAEVVDGLVADGEKYAGRDISEAGTSIRTKHEKMLKRTWQKESTGTEWYPPSPPRAGRPSLPRGLLPWTEQSGVWLAGQGKPGHTKRFVWSLACRNITEKILRSPQNLFSHRAGSTNMPVQLLSTSKKSVFESVIRSSAPASMKNPLCNFDLKITWSRKISWPPWLKLR